MKPFNLILLILLISISSNIIDAQRIYVEKETLYGSKINIPVKIEVQKKQLDYVFFATNKSYYPYMVHLEIKEIVNLSPPSVDGWYKVNPGRTRLVELTTQDMSRNSDYRYEYTYSIGAKAGRIDLDHPYLIPVKSKFDLLVNETANDDILPNQFKLSQGDTIYAARRGKIVVTPDLFDGTDRISSNNSVEIMHQDNTIMIYENLDPENVLMMAGKDVYPGQPIGVVNSSEVLKLILYQSTGDGYLEEVEIKYYLDKNSIKPFSKEMKGIEVSHPMEVITREFRRRELKSLEKGDLEL